MEVKSRDFGKQLDWLAQNRNVVDIDTALSRWEDPNSDRMVVLTFDDGYRDTYTTAFPLLQERGFPFTLYLSTESVETGRALGPSPQADPLRWSDVEAMLASGLVTIGSHTHRHRDLRLSDSDEIEYELTVSDALIAERVGVVSRHFAYPWGYWSAQADALVRERYDSAVLGGSPRPHPRPGAHEVHRYPVQLDDGFTFFKARVTGGLALEEWVRHRLEVGVTDHDRELAGEPRDASTP